MKARVWTVPNQITFLRLGFLPLFLILVLYEEYRWALIVLVFVAGTDFIDGLLAACAGDAGGHLELADGIARIHGISFQVCENCAISRIVLPPASRNVRR